MIDILETNMIWNRFDLQGASKEIREAITNHTAESELQAWTTVLPLVLKVGCSFLSFITVIQYNDRNYIIYYITELQLKTFFEFSRKLEDLVPKILNELCDKNLANSLQRNGTVGCEKASEQLEAHQVSKRSFHIAISYLIIDDGNVSVIITVRQFISIYRPSWSNLPSYLISY